EVDFILDGGKTKVGIESTIITLNDKGFEILRHGAITREEIEKLIPYNSLLTRSKNIIAPGMLKSHYSPDKPLYIADDFLLRSINRSKAGLLSFTGNQSDGFKVVINLTSNKNLKEYAVNLFAAIHKLEESDVECIVAEPVPEHGIGFAIMDRLRKAAYKNSVAN
ncbi:MAG: Sua5 family C-terminal domain-containing protein, partial [Ignavibacteria bacterium]|nr:Sua5 family C-terminal domain-containing protein [Ignavibacteria bacterium]